MERRKFDGQKVSKDHLDLVLAVDANNDLQLFCSSRYDDIIVFASDLGKVQLSSGQTRKHCCGNIIPRQFFFRVFQWANWETFWWEILARRSLKILLALVRMLKNY